MTIGPDRAATTKPAAGAPRRWLSFAGRALLALAILASGLWGGLALWFRAPGPDAVRSGILVLWALLAGGALVGSLYRRRWARLGYGLAFLALALWWLSIRPSHDRVWEPDVSRLATATIEGDRLTVRNVRNFDWRSDTDFTPRWEDRTYDLSKVNAVDVFFSYWAGPAIAHVIVSFGFENAAPLAFSIEIRKEKGEAYSALAGFFKSYELNIVPADERDVVRVRANVRGEDVRLYRLGVGPENARRLLERYAGELNAIAARPVWYNTARDNCTTLAFGYARALWPHLSFDWRVLFSGYGPRYAYDIGAVDTSLPFDELQRRASIAAAARAADAAPDFSARIREGVPRPQ